MEKTRDQIDIRRNSTGSFGMKENQSLALPLPLPLPIPNYLRASMGSCHDYCKYGKKRDITENVKTYSANVKTKNSTSQAKKEVIIQQKLKQKAMIPKRPNELKKEVSKPQSRRCSDVCIQIRSFTNGRSNDVKNASKMVCVPKTTSRSVKRDSKNAPPKGLPQSKNKPSKAKTMIEEQSFEIPVEKILYVDEITPVKQHACGIAQEEVERVYDNDSPIQTLSSKERNDPSNLKALSLSVPQETEDMSYIDVKALSLCVPQETEDLSYIDVKALALSVPHETEDMSYIDVKALSLCVPHETEDMSYIDVKALSLCVPHETEDMNYINVKALPLCVPQENEDLSYIDDKALALSVPHETEDMSYIDVKALSLCVPQETEDISYIDVKALSLSSDSFASVTMISSEPDSDSSPRDLEFKKDNNVDDQCDEYSQMRLKLKTERVLDDDCESTETTNESTKVVLRHQNTEEKRLPETERKLVVARKNKVQALVSAFEALISIEDNKSSGTARNSMIKLSTSLVN